MSNSTPNQIPFVGGSPPRFTDESFDNHRIVVSASPSASLEAASASQTGLESNETFATTLHHMAPSSKRRKRRGGRKKMYRRKSFAALAEESNDERESTAVDPQGEDIHREESVFHSLTQRRRRMSSVRDNSETENTRRDQMPSRIRRDSMLTISSSYAPAFTTQRIRTRADSASSNSDVHSSWGEDAPLISRLKRSATSGQVQNYGSNSNLQDASPTLRSRPIQTPTNERHQNVNYPSSIPGSPALSAVDGDEMTFGDVMIRHELSHHTSEESIERNSGLTDMDEDVLGRSSSPLHKYTSSNDDDDPRSRRIDDKDEDTARQSVGEERRRRRRRWPDLSAMEDWSAREKKNSTGLNGPQRVTEPRLINGRLRPTPNGWQIATDEVPYRFTYFNEELPSTIHSQSISDLVQDDGSFRGLFVPDRRVLSDDESDDDSDDEQVSFSAHLRGATHSKNSSATSSARVTARSSSTPVNPSRELSPRPIETIAGLLLNNGVQYQVPLSTSPYQTSQARTQPEVREKIPRLGDRPVWWLDVMNPTEGELKTLSKAFGLHPLTAEDIMLQEAREKVELFRHYYFVNYRTFEQDSASGEYLEPVNMYVVVFREGVLSFHFGVTPHAANVRRRVRQLRDYLIVSSDWISYAIIDDITDTFVPLIQSIEDEVDDIDEAILKMHTFDEEKDDPLSPKPQTLDNASIRSENSGFSSSTKTSSSMLKRVGNCRKRVILLYRLLGNKADVIKGFAKRCNERCEVAPRSEIGLYLGDIQDHIVTMTSNLSHYERMLARSHANYLAQINIEMNERQEQTADVLGKLTVLGTIVLPMNIITGLWGMNVWVPGQGSEESLVWFMWITMGLLVFGFVCYMVAKRVYNIV